MKTTTLAVIAMVLLAFLVAPIVSASNADNGLYDDKYVATKPDMGTMTGIIRGALNIGTIGMTEGLVVLGPDGTRYHPELTQYGTFELNDLAPGVYTIYIADGNSGQAESATATVCAGQISHPESMLIGHAVSELGLKTESKHVDYATYGVEGAHVNVTEKPSRQSTWVSN